MVLKRIKKTIGRIVKKVDDVYTHPVDREKKEAEAYFKSSEGQEELRQNKVELHKINAIVSAKTGDFQDVVQNLEGLLEVAKENEIPGAEELKETLNFAGKQAIATAYDQHGIDYKSINHIVHNLAKAYTTFLKEELDEKEYVLSVNKSLIDNLEDMLRSITDEPKNLAQLEKAVDIAEKTAEQITELLEYTDFPEDEKENQKHIAYKLLAQNLMGMSYLLAESGRPGELALCSWKLLEALDHTGNTPEERETIEAAVEEQKVICYNTIFDNKYKEFVRKKIGLEEMRECAEINNRVVKEAGIPEENKPEHMRYLKDIDYKFAIHKILHGLSNNGQLPKDVVNRVIHQVWEYLPFAGLEKEKEEQYRTKIGDILLKHGCVKERKPTQPWKRNGVHKKQSDPHLNKRFMRYSKKHR
ncbi:hypothetical protein KY346_02465 [Candidatus Woesearchaeota archaeon]|nr:hypothetical protein [Candidatus Woesearchaeota archaeon]